MIGLIPGKKAKHGAHNPVNVAVEIASDVDFASTVVSDVDSDLDTAVDCVLFTISLTVSFCDSATTTTPNFVAASAITFCTVPD